MPNQDLSRLSVSVIIPTYNRAAFIGAAIDSALKQTRMPDEVIVVDDGSNDETQDILSTYGAPVRVLRQRNRGRSAARNTGLRAARGDLILFLDSDDMLAPQCIERCAQILETDASVSVVYTDAYVMDGAGHIVRRYSEVLRGRRPSGNIFGELARRCFLTVSSMVRRSCLADVSFEEGMEHCEDYDLWRKLAAQYQFHFVDEPLLYYRFHEAMTNVVAHAGILASEVEVQRRFMMMPEFAKLTRREKARVYCTHGIKNVMLERSDTARRFFRTAMRTCPTYLGGLFLTGISIFGESFLRYMIIQRRRLAGNRLGTDAGPLAAVHRPAATKVNPSPNLQGEECGNVVLSEN
jgi:glycosyltransferase involved in cell wall biosynthesis